MTDEPRRYRDDEIEEIFARAADESVTRVPVAGRPEGLTLAQLQEVGDEVGLAPERIAAAATALDRLDHMPPPARRDGRLLHPVAVRRSVDLTRAPTDHEWEQLVAEFREAFGLRGEVRSRDAAREWTDGTLHIFVEPSATGTRLRMTAERRAEIEVAAIGGLAAVVGLLLLVTRGLDAATFGMVYELLIPVVLSLLGGAFVTATVLRARRWADRDEARMERIADRATALLAGDGSTQGR
jgi:hypothetical protein